MPEYVDMGSISREIITIQSVYNGCRFNPLSVGTVHVTLLDRKLALPRNKEIKLINKCKKNYEIENSKSLNVSLHSI